MVAQNYIQTLVPISCPLLMNLLNCDELHFPHLSNENASVFCTGLWQRFKKGKLCGCIKQKKLCTYCMRFYWITTVFFLLTPDFLWIPSAVPLMSSLFSRIQSGHLLQLVVMFSLPSLTCYSFFSSLSLFFMTLRILKSTGQIPCGMGLSVVFHMINWSYVLERIPQRWSALFIPSYNQRHMLPHNLTGDVNLHRLFTVVFAKFLHFTLAMSLSLLCLDFGTGSLSLTTLGTEGD